jgi:hypothetical protein
MDVKKEIKREKENTKRRKNREKDKASTRHTKEVYFGRYRGQNRRVDGSYLDKH